ncbi:2-keto-4-pentenoate hydratase [Paenalcaligenes sp. Me131]|uniref:2-keto-4-pentenoate hydratase n=1 Tax=Paenalcaligenes sp. Me131 TaxID=3392636 RepID=UPI003D2A562F
MQSVFKDIATHLDAAALTKQAVEQYAPGTFDLEQAYAIQRESIAHRVARGHAIRGVKLGFTSRAKMKQMGVDDLIWGWLTNDMLFEEGSNISLSAFIHPRVEPEVCFLTKRAITGPITALEAVQYIEAVAPALEIIDSRFQNFKFDLNNVVADNCSSSGLVVGEWSSAFTALHNAFVSLSVDGRPVQLGSTAAILGNPLRAIVQVSRLLGESGQTLPAGSLIMAGAATAAEAMKAGTYVDVDVRGVGQAGFHVVS